MAQFLQIAQLGNAVLRKTAEPVTDIQAPEIQELIEDMLATVVESNGVGLAAPQVYQSKRIIIVASHPNARYPNAPLMAPTAMINPEIISHSEETFKDWEGCLSIPGIRGLVPRWKKIIVNYLNRNGDQTTAEFEDFAAKIFQHEIDHLDGIMFLDKMENNKEIISDKEYLKLIGSKNSK